MKNGILAAIILIAFIGFIIGAYHYPIIMIIISYIVGVWVIFFVWWTIKFILDLINNKKQQIVADFSKQWCDANDPDMPYDFDIMEEYHKVKPGSYVPYICEGFGFIAIGKWDDNDETCMLAIPVENAPFGTVVWKAYDQVIK